VLHAFVNPQGKSTTYYFQVGLTASVYSTTTATHSAGSGTKTVEVTAGIGGLTPATVYHYRVVATSKLGGSFGVDRSFKTTGNPPPTAVTGPTIRVGHAFGVVTGTVGTQGEATHWAFQWGTTAAYGNQTFGGSIPASVAPVTISETLGGLSAGTTFHYRLVAFHGNVASSVGLDQTFTTFPFPRLHAKVRASTLPTIAASKPYLFTTTGSILPPATLPPGVACSGIVAVRFVTGHRAVATRIAAVQPNCTFTSQVLFHRLIRKHARRLRVEVRFRGNNYLVPASARAQRVRLGI
jgi:hypothetical protein